MGSAISCCKSSKKEERSFDEEYGYSILQPEGLDDFNDHAPDFEAIDD